MWGGGDVGGVGRWGGGEVGMWGGGEVGGWGGGGGGEVGGWGWGCPRDREFDPGFWYGYILHMRGHASCSSAMGSHGLDPFKNPFTFDMIHVHPTHWDGVRVYA
jgi:hypothetical protein